MPPKILCSICVLILLYICNAIAAAETAKPAGNKIVFFQFTVGGFSEGYTTIIIDGQKKQLTTIHPQDPNKTLKGKELQIWLKENKEFNTVTQTAIKPTQMTAFENSLEKCSLKLWNKKYINKEIIDGTTWDVNIVFKNNESITSSGVNEFPKKWDAFIKTIEKISGKKLTY